MVEFVLGTMLGLLCAGLPGYLISHYQQLEVNRTRKDRDDLMDRLGASNFGEYRAFRQLNERPEEATAPPTVYLYDDTGLISGEAPPETGTL